MADTFYQGAALVYCHYSAVGIGTQMGACLDNSSYDSAFRYMLGRQGFQNLQDMGVIFPYFSGDGKGGHSR